jgi:peptidoglycan/LPS O-acetylase OafA/YrhL
LLFALGVISTLLIGNIRPQVPDLLVGAATVSAMIALTQAVQNGLRPWALRVLERAPLVSLGRFSYSLYLLHAPLLALFFVIARKLGLGLTSIQFFILVVGLPVTVMASYVFYLVFERPFVNARPAPAPDWDVVLPGAKTYVSRAPLHRTGADEPTFVELNHL